MAATASTMLSLGTAAPDFNLPDVTGRLVSRDDFAGSPALLVMFLCNHCPYGKHVAEELVRLAGEYQARGAEVVAISSNDVAQFPEDGPARMAEVAAAMGPRFHTCTTRPRTWRRPTTPPARRTSSPSPRTVG